jgi:chemotaxis protein methyltransferase CheR
VTAGERDYVAWLCREQAGLVVDAERVYLLENRLGVVARREGFASVSDLVRAVRDRAEERLVWAVVEAMAPAQTAFFRDPAVFEALASDLEMEARHGARPRVWSAGAGAGQEIYSLAMLLIERGVEGVELFASDLSSGLIDRAQAGVYSTFEVQHGLSARRLVRHFENQDDAFVISAEIRRRVRWRRINLLEVRPAAEVFDVILCRNVLSGLTQKARERVLAALAGRLAPGGRLILGAEEEVPSHRGLVQLPGRPCAFRLAADARVAA